MGSLSVTSRGELALSLSEAKRALRVLHDDDDVDIMRAATAARDYVEKCTGRVIGTATVTYKLDCFPKGSTALVLPCPIASITTLQYWDGDNATQTLVENTDYTKVLMLDALGELAPIADTEWPTTYQRRDAITITMVTPAASANEKHAIALKLQIDYDIVDRFAARSEAAERSLNAIIRSLQTGFYAGIDKRLTVFA